MMCHYVIFDFAFSCTQSALIALPHTDISRKGNMTNISHLTLPFPPSLHLSRVHNHPSSSNQRHLDPQPPQQTTPTPDATSPCITQPSTLNPQRLMTPMPNASSPRVARPSTLNHLDLPRHWPCTSPLPLAPDHVRQLNNRANTMCGVPERLLACLLPASRDCPFPFLAPCVVCPCVLDQSWDGLIHDNVDCK